jgi:RIO-like serine/threonine protein kinase
MTLTIINEDNYCYYKPNVTLHEYKMYKYLDNLEFKYIPKLYDYNKDTKVLKTQKIYGMTIADLYGENWNNIPKLITKQIRDIITRFYTMGIVYPDITGYNFIQDNKTSRIWVVDFEHCFCMNLFSREPCYNDEEIKHIEFVKKFCFKNACCWNPNFA